MQYTRSLENKHPAVKPGLAGALSKGNKNAIHKKFREQTSGSESGVGRCVDFPA
jgi:hypothetical protein